MKKIMRELEPLTIYYREMYFSHGFIELKAYPKKERNWTLSFEPYDHADTDLVFVN